MLFPVWAERLRNTGIPFWVYGCVHLDLGSPWNICVEAILCLKVDLNKTDLIWV